MLYKHFCAIVLKTLLKITLSEYSVNVTERMFVYN